jgi:hypothetical protein
MKILEEKRRGVTHPVPTNTNQRAVRSTAAVPVRHPGPGPVLETAAGKSLRAETEVSRCRLLRPQNTNEATNHGN